MSATSASRWTSRNFSMPPGSSDYIGSGRMSRLPVAYGNATEGPIVEIQLRLFVPRGISGGMVSHRSKWWRRRPISARPCSPNLGEPIFDWHDRRRSPGLDALRLCRRAGFHTPFVLVSGSSAKNELWKRCTPAPTTTS